MDLSWLPTAYVPYVIGAAVILVGLRALSAILNPRREPEGVFILKQCPCGWSGRVSRHSPVCRRCGAELPLH